MDGDVETSKESWFRGYVGNHHALQVLLIAARLKISAYQEEINLVSVVGLSLFYGTCKEAWAGTGGAA